MLWWTLHPLALPRQARKMANCCAPKDQVQENTEANEKSCPDGHPHPAKLYESHHFNSKRWEKVTPRDGDIYICTAAKSGTTWTQSIVYSIVYHAGNAPDGASVGDLSPWVDLRVPPDEVLFPPLEASKDQRFLKTHLPADAAPWNPK